MVASARTASVLNNINVINNSSSAQLTTSAALIIRSGQTLSRAARRGHNKLAEGRDVCLVAVETLQPFKLNMLCLL